MQILTHRENVSFVKKITYTDLLDADFDLVQTGDSCFCSFHFDVINKELWCTRDITTTIFVLDFDGNQTDVLDFENPTQIFSVVHFDSAAIFASPNGMFILHDQKNAKKFYDGCYIDVCKHQNLLFALEYLVA